MDRTGGLRNQLKRAGYVLSEPLRARDSASCCSQTRCTACAMVRCQRCLFHGVMDHFWDDECGIPSTPPLVTWDSVTTSGRATDPSDATAASYCLAHRAICLPAKSFGFPKDPSPMAVGSTSWSAARVRIMLRKTRPLWSRGRERIAMSLMTTPRTCDMTKKSARGAPLCIVRDGGDEGITAIHETCRESHERF